MKHCSVCLRMSNLIYNTNRCCAFGLCFDCARAMDYKKYNVRKCIYCKFQKNPLKYVHYIDTDLSYFNFLNCIVYRCPLSLKQYFEPPHLIFRVKYDKK